MHLFAGLRRFWLGQIDAHDRGSFGETVTFKNSLAESFLETFGQIEGQFFRAREDQSQTAQLMRLDFAKISTQKSRSGQQQGQLILLDQVGILGRFQRIWIRHDGHTFYQGIPKRYGRPKAMKERKRRENTIMLISVKQDIELRDVAENIAMAKDHSFRLARATARKKKDCFGVPARFRNSQ